MRDARNIYDFNDFKEVVASKGNCEALEQFADFPNGSNQSKAKPKLRAVKIIQFRRGETYIFWKEKYNQTDFFSTPFLKVKITKIIKDKHRFDTKPFKYISEDRKSRIIENLCPLMPESRKAFYNNIITQCYNHLICFVDRLLIIIKIVILIISLFLLLFFPYVPSRVSETKSGERVF